MKLKIGLLCVVALCTNIQAQTPPDAQVPPSLRDWRPWVLKDLAYRACPFLANSLPQDASAFLCAWPGRLTLASGAQGAQFSLRWRVEAPGWVPLPGDEEHWPQQVTVNAQRQPVLAHAFGDGEGEEPALWLQPGTYDAAGRIPWSEQPQSLHVPGQIGLIALNVDGKPVVPVQRDGDEVTLGRAAAAAPEADSLELRVYRKLADGVPSQLITRIQINVSGQAREEVFGPALPVGFEPLALTSAWPARLDGDGKLHVQVQPGSQTLALAARATAPLKEASARVPADPWPQQEIWSYEAVPQLRVTAASGALQVDPRQAEVPPDWQALPAFALGDGAKLAIEERSRGLAADEANRLGLQREAWLDFDGAGWYARDRIGGTMQQGWRFDVAAPFSLQQATALHAGEQLLITRGAQGDTSGVEWRTPRVDLAAGVRIAAPASMPIAGWQQTFDNVQATLHFPFGYKLLGAPGADSAAGSWIAGWTLLDVFVCAILVLLAWRLLGWAGALASVAYLLLGYQEFGHPFWTLLAAFAFALIVRALPAGRLATTAEWLRRATLALLVLWTLGFVADQVRFALYPQLENGGYYAAYDGTNRVRMSRDTGFAAPAGVVNDNMPAEPMSQLAEEKQQFGNAASTPMAPPPPPRPAQAKAGALDTIVVTGSNIRRVDVETANPIVTIDRAALQKNNNKIEHYSQSTVVQTGAGAPSWTVGSTAWLSWSGPVVATQSVRLLVAPPWVVRPLRIVLVVLLGWLIWRLVRGAGTPRVPRAAAALGIAALALGGMLSASSAQAQNFPPQDLLNQLRTRSIEAPKCAPSCASAAEAQVSANGESVSVTLEVHAGERVAVPLPNDAAGASIKSIQVDGVADDALARDAQGMLWIALGRGVHRVQIEFAAAGDKVALSFPLKPARVLFQGKGWEASGLSEDRLLTETLTLARAHDSGRATPSAGVQQFPPYVQVQRDLSLGLEWTSSTTVLRQSPAQGGFTVDVPLLAGEHVSSAGIKVQNGKVPAAIGEGATSASWQSTLDRGDALTLTAPALGERAEVWTIMVSPTWHVEFSGVPGVGLTAGEDPNDDRRFEFHPLPGETLALRITRPAAAQGASRALDAVSLTSQIGQRASAHHLTFTLRASQGGDQVLTLPKDAEILSVTRDGQTLNVRLLDGKLSLPIVPGTHGYVVSFRDTGAADFFVRTPPLSLGLPAANVAIGLDLPGDRWLLAAFGPAVGPAVLYWGELIVMAGIAFVLARTRRTRLKFHHWLLLGLGFSTFSWGALLIVVAWLFAFDWRARSVPSAVRWRFNLSQVLLVLLAAAALLSLASAIPQGLLGQPDMHVTGNGSSAQALHWFTDKSADALPQASAVSLPLWVYKLLMLAWALWLANAVIGWLREAFAAWTQGGYWRGKPQPAPAAPAPEPEPAASA